MTENPHIKKGKEFVTKRHIKQIGLSPRTSTLFEGRKKVKRKFPGRILDLAAEDGSVLTCYSLFSKRQIDIHVEQWQTNTTLPLCEFEATEGNPGIPNILRDRTSKTPVR